MFSPALVDSGDITDQFVPSSTFCRRFSVSVVRYVRILFNNSSLFVQTVAIMMCKV